MSRNCCSSNCNCNSCAKKKSCCDDDNDGCCPIQKNNRCCDQISCPIVSDKIMNIHFNVSNSEDLGTCGYWAIDNFTVHLVVWIMPDDQLYANATVVGTWSTIKNARSPQTCVLQARNAIGKLTGFVNGKFPIGTTIVTPLKFGNTGTVDFNGNYADLLLPSGSQTETERLTDYISSLFSAPLIVLVASANYYLDEQLLWVDTTAGAVGDVIIDTNGCPAITPV